VPQNQVGYGLSVVPQNRWEDEDGVGHASRFSGLLHVEESQGTVSQYGLKTGRDAARRGWCTWHLRGGRVEMKLKTDESMRRAALDFSTPTLSFSLY
jgi:hypothetical protein